MNCKKCGNPLGPTDIFCKSCGEPVTAAPSVAPIEPVNLGTTTPQEVAPTPITPAATEVPPVINPVSTESVNPIPVAPPPAAPVNPVPTPVQPVLNLEPAPIAPIAPTADVNAEVPAQSAEVPKGNNKLFTIIVVILLLAILAVGGYLLANKVLNNNNNGSNSANDNNQSEQATDTTNIFEYEGYQFAIPTKYTISIDNDNFLNLINKEGKVAIILSTLSGYNSEDIAAEIDSIKDSLIASSNGTVSSIENQEYDEIKWIKIHMNMQIGDSDKDIVTGIASLGNYNTIVNYIYNIGDTITNDEIFEDLSKIYANATYEGNQFTPGDKKDEFKSNLKSTFDTSIFD